MVNRMRVYCVCVYLDHSEQNEGVLCVCVYLVHSEQNEGVLASTPGVQTLPVVPEQLPLSLAVLTQGHQQV